MKGYRKPAGHYIEVQDGTPVGDTLIEVALRPSLNHVFSDTWNTDPLNAAVCWRLKAAAELSAEKTSELSAFLATASGKAVLALANVLITKNILTLAEIRAEYRTL